jgi:hypothetical protein
MCLVKEKPVVKGFKGKLANCKDQIEFTKDGRRDKTLIFIFEGKGDWEV